MTSISKNIKYDVSIAIRIDEVISKLLLMTGKKHTQFELIDRYIKEGLKRDEKFTKEIDL